MAAERRPDELETGVREHAGRRGTRTARAAAERMRVGSDSPGETRLRLLLEEHGIPGLVLDHPLLGPDGTLPAQPDLALESHRLSLQYEGAHRDREEQRMVDIRRLRATESAGWRELRICAHDLHQHTTTTRGPVPVVVALVWEAMGVAHRR